VYINKEQYFEGVTPEVWNSQKEQNTKKEEKELPQTQP